MNRQSIYLACKNLADDSQMIACVWTRPVMARKFACMKLTTPTRIIATTLFIASAMPVGILAQEEPAQDSNSEHTHHVKMAFSGTSENSANNLQYTNTSNDEDNFAGNGPLGSFTVRLLRAIDNSPSSSPTCSGSNYLYLVEPGGGGVFRFHDGSLLYVNLTKGSDCINLEANDAHCTLIFQVTGGTGRFKHASGVLTMTELVLPVVNGPADNPNNPVLFAATGEFTGTVSGVAAEEEAHDEQQ
ncbi:MAG: hypothetical protein JO108_37055 [Acidobacteriaceae bacterium]|nr:hypothetical protein [Acidobacteriaceae bacterium]